MINQELLEILVCPETKEPVHLADKALLAALNARIERGEVKTRGDQTVEQRIEAGLVREDGAYLYPIADDIPLILCEGAIPLAPAAPAPHPAERAPRERRLRVAAGAKVNDLVAES